MLEIGTVRVPPPFSNHFAMAEQHKTVKLCFAFPGGIQELNYIVACNTFRLGHRPGEGSCLLGNNIYRKKQEKQE
jgi:hypothetical protein